MRGLLGAFAILAAMPGVFIPDGGSGLAQRGRRALPDLRIVSMDVQPNPMIDRQSATVTLRLHNDSPTPAAGSIAIQVAHDRGLPAPLPAYGEVIYMGADALAEVTFDIQAPRLEASPYTFVAMVDALDAIAESDEFNNTSWERVSVCGSPDASEVADGLDNDCDGLADEGLGLSADPGDALRLLREVQERARRDSAQLLYRPARVFAPWRVERSVSLRADDGQFVGESRRNPGSLRAFPRGRLIGTEMVLVDWDGGDLVDGDLVSFRDERGAFIVAEGGGGGSVAIRARYRESERLFTLVEQGADGFSFIAASGQFVSAEGGGGGPLLADRGAAGGWETFRLIFD